jgi:nucleotide-binding universal stress UspA family protein
MLIVFASDGSAGALAAGQFLACLPLSAADRIVIVTAHAEDAAGEQMLIASCEALAGTAAAVETELRAGPAADEILECARERSADLMVVGAMGTTGLARFFIGSTAERVLRHADRPVLVGRPMRHGLKRALIGVDASPVATRVVEAAATFPLPPETELMLATVLPSQEALVGAAPLVWTSLSGELDNILKSAVIEAEDRLRALARVLQDRGENVAAEVLRGDPATALISHVDSEEADLAIVGSHGEGGVDRFLLGSVSERLARHARSSVLVVR